MLIELRNDFHNTAVRVAGAHLSPGVWRRVRRELCGRRGCTCGIVRGPQAKRLLIEEDGRGGARITVEGRACPHAHSSARAAEECVRPDHGRGRALPRG